MISGFWRDNFVFLDNVDGPPFSGGSFLSCSKKIFFCLIIKIQAEKLVYFFCCLEGIEGYIFVPYEESSFPNPFELLVVLKGPYSVFAVSFWSQEFLFFYLSFRRRLKSKSRPENFPERPTFL